MRLIDADELKNKIDLTSLWDQNDYDLIKRIIDNTPTVDDRTREVLSQQATIRKLLKAIEEGAKE